MINKEVTVTFDTSHKETHRLHTNRSQVRGDGAEVARKQWTEPALSVYGTVADITRACDDKLHGPTDGIALKAPPIQCAS